MRDVVFEDTTACCEPDFDYERGVYVHDENCERPEALKEEA